MNKDKKTALFLTKSYGNLNWIIQQEIAKEVRQAAIFLLKET